MRQSNCPIHFSLCVCVYGHMIDIMKCRFLKLIFLFFSKGFDLELIEKTYNTYIGSQY
jgi:hypothetical protein